MLAYGDARVSQRRHNRHRHRHHRRQGRRRRRGRPCAGTDTNSASVAGACPRSPRARCRRGLAAGPAGGPCRPGPARREGGGGHGDGAVADRRGRQRRARHPGPAVRRQPGPVGRRAPTARSSRARRSNSCAGRLGRRPMRPGTGRRRPWPTTRWRARPSSTSPPPARPIRCSMAWLETTRLRGLRRDGGSHAGVETTGTAVGQVREQRRGAGGGVGRRAV